MKMAREKMKELAKEISNQYPEHPTEEEWEDIKEIVRQEANDWKHQVYGEARENFDRRQGYSSEGHEDRAMIFHELKNAFHEEWKKLRKAIEEKKLSDEKKLLDVI